MFHLLQRLRGRFGSQTGERCEACGERWPCSGARADRRAGPVSFRDIPNEQTRELPVVDVNGPLRTPGQEHRSGLRWWL